MQRTRKPRKSKTKKLTLSKQYRDTESEISTCMQSQKLQIPKFETNEIPIETHIEFFAHSVSTEKLSLEDINHQPDEPSADSDTAGAISNPSPARQSEQYQNQSAASYIQIENVIGSPVQPLNKIKINFNDDEFLFVPSSEKIANIDEFDEESQQFREDGRVYFDKFTSTTSPNMTKMVNRFNEEGNIQVIASADLLKNQKSIHQEKRVLYKTEQDPETMATFRPIFYSLPLSYMADKLVTSKKVISITVKELLFTDHPLQTEEHRLANKLENLYNSYVHKIQQNLIPKINFELVNIRGLSKNLLRVAGNEDFDKLEMYMKQTKILRRKLHREELAVKTLIQNSLETWVLLKNCRKQQGFNYTDFRLVIKVDEVDANEDEQAWNERYHLELSEVLREEFEKYYVEKRNRKSIRNAEDSRVRPLRKPDMEIIKMDVLEILKNCTRQPGEPKIKLGEFRLADRCKNLEKFKDYCFSILFDGELVGTTKNFRLTSNFNIEVNQTFGVYLERKIPNNIQIEIYEKSKLSQRQKITSANIPLDVLIDYTVGYSESVEFTSPQLQNITGILKVNVYSDTELFSSPEDLIACTVNSKPHISKDILRNWYDNNLINPLNPDYLALNNVLKDEEQQADDNNQMATENDNDNTFNFNEDTILTFCSKNEIMNNQRFNMLRARHNKEMKYKDFKFIPLFENELEDISDEKNLIIEGDWIEPIDLYKYKGKKYLRKLYDLLVNHCIQLNKDEDASNLLTGNDPPTFRSILDGIIGFFGPSRPLNPPKTNQISLPLNGFQNFNIVVNVVRATGIPIRNFVQNFDRRRDSSGSVLTGGGQNIKYGNVRPFVSISYKDKSARTITADGSNPTYNEQLLLQLSGNTMDLKDDVKFQIFDEYIEDLLNDDSSRSMEIYQRIHTNWLGEYRIPINTIFKRQRIEGAFEMTTPKLLIGYTKPSIDPSDGTIPIENIPEIRESVYLWLYISVEPQFDMPTLRTSGLECSELKEVKNHLHEWCVLVKDIQPKRFLDPMASLATGKRVCMTRLLESIPLPVGSGENLENFIRRYVSLIPIMKTSNACIGLEGIWLNNQITLDATWASPKDLGVLLACFYLNLGVRCWLALGIGYPYGESAFVLKLESSYYVLLDPCTGKKYQSKDVNCPLISVQYIIGQDNVYCNLQRENHVSMTDFNMNDSSLWLPLFGKKNPAPIGGVHQLNYNYKTNYSTHDLRKSIERKIMKKINSWRSTRKTVWNRGFSDILFGILNDLEQDIILDRSGDNYIDRLTRDFPNFKYFGFTLNFTYTNLSSISERIRQTGIHLNTDRNVEFAVAVYLHQYPNNILSCWIFIMSVIPF